MMSNSIEEERKRLKCEWEALNEPKPAWEEWKRMSVKKRNTYNSSMVDMKSKKSIRTDRGHGSPYDRGSADSWYGREAIPHYYEADTYGSARIGKDEMSEEEIAEYWRGYDDNEADLSARKEW